VIHLYAVTADAPPALDVLGIDGVPLHHPACGALHATISEHPRAPTVSADSATAHAAVVAAVAEQVPAVPIRFGVDHTDVGSLQEALAEVERSLLDTLARIGDGVEFVVRATAAPPPAPQVTIPANGTVARGRTYLEERLRERHALRDTHERIAADLATVTAPLIDRALDTADRVGHAGPERCFLVPRAQAPRFAAAAGEALDGRDDLLVGGPWPPYTFAGEAVSP
jgi:hypothetical protein